MSMCCTYYVVIGYAIRKAEVKKIFRRMDKDNTIEEKLRKYYDNHYDSKIKSKLGMSVIADGCNGDYIVVGKVISKAVERDGYNIFTVINDSYSRAFDSVNSKVAKIDEILKTSLASRKPSVIAFCHIH